ncbi:MAG: outer membrane beta-barrel protein [Bacteroidota bacterium]
MKKTAITLILLISFAFTGLSQMVIKPGIGMNFTRMSSDLQSYETTGRLGWQLGGTVTFGEKFYFEPGIFWVKNNWNLQELSTSLPEFKNDISSLRIPAFVGINLLGDATDDLNFHLFGGPAAQIVTKVNTNTTNLTPEDFSKFILSMNLGAGISINKIFIDAGYEWGLTNIYINDPNNVQNRGFWLNAGFRLEFL